MQNPPCFNYCHSIVCFGVNSVKSPYHFIIILVQNFLGYPQAITLPNEVYIPTALFPGITLCLLIIWERIDMFTFGTSFLETPLHLCLFRYSFFFFSCSKVLIDLPPQPLQRFLWSKFLIRFSAFSCHYEWDPFSNNTFKLSIATSWENNECLLNSHTYVFY